MQFVGDELEKLALGNGDVTNADLLGRSAFNRYYYAAFLKTRETLGLMQESWRGTAHANIPQLLEEGLKGPAQHALNRMVRAKLIDQGDKARILRDLNITANGLAQLLREAYDARLIADYQPEIKTERENDLIKLKSYKLTTAKEWPSRANQLCARLLKIWKEFSIV